MSANQVTVAAEVLASPTLEVIWQQDASAYLFTRSPAGELSASIGAHAAHIRAHLTPGQRNHRTLELHALFVAALALPEIDPGGQLGELAIAQLHENLLAGTFADGVHRECSTHYHLWVLQSF